MYIYHLTTVKNLHKIIGNKFCAPLYAPERTNLMHKELHALHDSLSEGRSLFRFCFYAIFEKARESYERDVELWDRKILRFKMDEFKENGFSWQWDEGFNEGVAHLFWIEESDSDNGYSQAGIHFQSIDILMKEQWIPLSEYFSKLEDRTDAP